MYGAFSTLFPETALIGNIGKIIGDTNLHLFGYFAYINIFVLFIHSINSIPMLLCEKILTFI